MMPACAHGDLSHIYHARSYSRPFGGPVGWTYCATNGTAAGSHSQQLASLCSDDGLAASSGPRQSRHRQVQDLTACRRTTCWAATWLPQVLVV
jgi:hypothetical protein